MSDLDLPAISRLSEELIAIIADYIVHQPENQDVLDTKGIKSLRLTHPRLACSSSIQHLLFGQIRLSARHTRRDLRAFRSIAPSVKTVIFEAMQLVPHTGSQDDPLGDGYWGRQTRSWVAAREYLNSGRAVSDWVEVLRAACNLETVSVLGPVRQWVRRRAAQERAETVPGTDELLSVVLKCLATAGAKPRKLVLYEGDESPYLGWHAARDWAMVDLSRLEHLDVSLRFDMIGLLSTCASSLKSLHAGPHHGLRSSIGHYVSLPALEDLSLYDACIEPVPFASWLLQCGRIRRLSLDKTKTYGRQFLRSWRPVFDAIRTHDNRMHVCFSAFLTIVERDALTLNHHTSQAPVRRLHDSVDNHVAYEIEKYMSNAGDWSLQEYEGLL